MERVALTPRSEPRLPRWCHTAYTTHWDCYTRLFLDSVCTNRYSRVIVAVLFYPHRTPTKLVTKLVTNSKLVAS